MAPFLMSPLARAQLARVQQAYPAQVRQPSVQQPGAQPFAYQMIDQTTGKPFQFGQTEPAPVSAAPANDPNTGASAGGDGPGGRIAGHTGVAANLDQKGLFGTEPGFTNYGMGLGIVGSLSGIPGLGTAGTAVGTGIDWNNAKDIFSLFSEMKSDPDYLSALGASLTHGMLGQSLVGQYTDMIGNAAAGMDPSGMGASGGNAVSGPAGDVTFSQGGTVRQVIPPPPGVAPPAGDQGLVFARRGEHVLTQAQWKRLPKKSKKAASR